MVAPFRVRSRVCPERCVRITSPAEQRVRLGFHLYRVQKVRISRLRVHTSVLPCMCVVSTCVFA